MHMYRRRQQEVLANIDLGLLSEPKNVYQNQNVNLLNKQEK